MTTRTRPRGSLTSTIRDELAARIARGDLPPGQQLPTERQLVTEFGVSRVTVRRAIALLSEDGLVNAIQGRGTYVASELLAEPPNALLSFHDMVAGDRVVVGAEPLRADVRPATLREAEWFGIAPGAELFELERLRTLDGLPVAIDSNLLPLMLDPQLPELSWADQSLYSRLAEVGHAPVVADFGVEAKAADPRAATLLGTVVGSPLLVVESESREADGRAVVAGVTTYRGDRYRFRSTATAVTQRAVRQRTDPFVAR